MTGLPVTGLCQDNSRQKDWTERERERETEVEKISITETILKGN